MAPKWLQNSSLEASGRPLGPKGSPKGLPGALLEALGVLLAAPGGALGSLLAPLGAVLGLPGGPRRVPEGPREGPGGAPRGHFGDHSCSRASRHEKNQENLRLSPFSDVFLGCVSKSFLRLAGGAGARAHLGKNRFSLRGCCIFHLSAVFARNQKSKDFC